MKKYTSLARKGFTLVELMIVIAIIGILAAVLYPSMTGYFERSRDTNRQGSINQIALALNTYYVDHEEYPESTTLGCADLENKLVTGNTKYLKQMFTDPKKQTIEGCNNGGSYGYKRIPNTTGNATGAYVLAAKMESKWNGNLLKAAYVDTSTPTYETISTALSTTTKSQLADAENPTYFAVVNQ